MLVYGILYMCCSENHRVKHIYAYANPSCLLVEVQCAVSGGPIMVQGPHNSLKIVQIKTVIGDIFVKAESWIPQTISTSATSSLIVLSSRLRASDPLKKSIRSRLLPRNIWTRRRKVKDNKRYIRNYTPFS